jgi:hypothetical protein
VGGIVGSSVGEGFVVAVGSTVGGGFTEVVGCDDCPQLAIVTRTIKKNAYRRRPVTKLQEIIITILPLV